jgi:hypothetical protein
MDADIAGCIMLHWIIVYGVEKIGCVPKANVKTKGESCVSHLTSLSVAKTI